MAADHKGWVKIKAVATTDPFALSYSPSAVVRLLSVVHFNPPPSSHFLQSICLLNV
jgi:hypothetical protein